MCRLSHGTYFCGALASSAPYKGLSDTADTPHIGTDVVRGRAPTGGSRQTPGAGAFAKLQGAANPDYYGRATPTASAYVTNPHNNGQELRTPSIRKGNTVAYFNQHTLDHPEDPETRHAAAARASNYGMTRGEGRRYNQGIHVVGGHPSATGPPRYAMSDVVMEPADLH